MRFRKSLRNFAAVGLERRASIGLATVRVVARFAKTDQIPRRSRTCRLPCIARVPSCAFCTVIYLVLVSNGNHGAGRSMAKLKLGVIVGTGPP